MVEEVHEKEHKKDDFDYFREVIIFSLGKFCRPIPFEISFGEYGKTTQTKFYDYQYRYEIPNLERNSKDLKELWDKLFEKLKKEKCYVEKNLYRINHFLMSQLKE